MAEQHPTPTKPAEEPTVYPKTIWVQHLPADAYQIVEDALNNIPEIKADTDLLNDALNSRLSDLEDTLPLKIFASLTDSSFLSGEAWGDAIEEHMSTEEIPRAHALLGWDSIPCPNGCTHALSIYQEGDWDIMAYCEDCEQEECI